MEENGFDYVWIADENPTSPYRDVFVNMSAVALGTERVKIGTGICNPYSRHAALLAVAIATLDELSNGRAVLGIGAGGSLSLRPLCIEQWKKPLKAVRECITVTRRLLRGESVDFEGEVVKMRGVKLFDSGNRSVPIYLGAYGPKMLKLMGEVADGGLISSPLEYMPDTLNSMREGAEKAGRDPAEIDVANWLPFAVSHDAEKARELVKADVSYMIADSPRAMLERVGITKEDATAIRDALEKGIENTTRLVTDEMIDRYAIAGTPEHCKRRIAEFVKAGVTQVVLGAPFGPDQREAIRLVGNKIIPEF